MEALEELVEKETEAKEENAELASSLQAELDAKRKEIDLLRAQIGDADEAAKQLLTNKEELDKLKHQ